MTYPYSDEYMTYSYINHRYVLTEKCVQDELNINLTERLNLKGAYSRENVPQQLLDEVSIIVYNAVYNASNFNDFQEYLMAKAPSARKIIKDAMKQQLTYLITNGDVAKYAGINLQNGQVIDYNKLRGKVSLDMRAESILNRTLKETDVSLLYQGNYALPPSLVLDYETEEY